MKSTCSLDAGEANPVGRRTSAISREPSSAELVDQSGPQILNELAHRVGDGFDALEVENALMDAFDIVRLNNPAIEDARLIAGFFLVIATDPGFGNRPSCLEQGSLSASTGGSLRQKRPVVALGRSNNPKELVMSELIQSESTPQIRPLQERRSQRRLGWLPPAGNFGLCDRL
jgi:hypothetical protein